MIEHITLKQAVERIGGQTKTGSILGVSQQIVQYHLTNKRYPAEWVIPLAEVLGVSPTALRPDLYPPRIIKGDD